MQHTYLITLPLLLFGLSCQSQPSAPDNHPLLTFMVDHPGKSSLRLVRNDTILANFHSGRVMPLASTMKIVIAAEYAEQAAAGTVDPDALIPLDALDKFYVAHTDGGAHPAWLAASSDVTEDQQVPIREIARGMINFSSNANTEWLCQRLGLDNINEQIERLGARDHTAIYYTVSALFVGKERFPGVTGEALANKLSRLTTAAYRQATQDIHRKLLSDSTYRNDLGDLSMPIQRVWSDRLPRATTTDYVTIVQKINSRTFFDDQVQRYLDEVMEGILDNPANRQWLRHAGMKGGSTAFVLTKALYATDQHGNRTELAYFFNDLTPEENARLQNNMNAFELSTLTDPTFRHRVQQTLAH